MRLQQHFERNSNSAVVLSVQKTTSRNHEGEFTAGIQSFETPISTNGQCLPLLRSVMKKNNHHIYKIHNVDGTEITAV